MSSKITQDILESYVFCRSKGYLQWTGEYGMPSDYAMFLTQSRDEVRRKAMAKMLAQPHKDQVVQGTLLTTTGFASCKFIGDDLPLCGNLLGEPQLFPLLVKFHHF